MYMAGTLWKWTNYFSGWQARWFVLDKGILSYYKTQDDVNTGCKGSVKLSVCDITVHGTDNTRLDLIIPGEQYFYLKASSAQERQQWLVALGSTKASMGKIVEETENTTQHLLKTKKSELRLYCDLLMQQIHSVKVCVSDGEKPDIEKLDQSSSLISPTCDTFIRTLDECMQLVQSVILTFEGQQSLITDAALPSSPLKIPSKKGSNLTRQNSHDGISLQSFSRSLSVSINETASSGDQKFHKRRLSDAAISDQSKKELVSNSMIKMNIQNSNYGPSQNIVQSDMLELSSLSSNISDAKMGATDGVDVNNSSNCSQTGELIKLKEFVAGSNFDMSCNGHQTSDDNSGEDVFLDPYELKVPTFFSVMKTSFMNLKMTVDGGIPVEPFLESCKNLLPIFDKLNSTAFAPVKMDFQGNIRKVQTKYSMNPKDFTTLQNIILHEMSAGQEYLPSSATMALLWMKRSLEFIASFLMEIKLGEENLGTAASNAYAKSLKPFHGWVVRGVFAVAVKALPYRKTFVSLLNPGNKDIDHETFQTSLLQDLDAFCHAIIAVVKLLDHFFTAHNLNVHEQV